MIVISDRFCFLPFFGIFQFLNNEYVFYNQKNHQIKMKTYYYVQNSDITEIILVLHFTNFWGL